MKQYLDTHDYSLLPLFNVSYVALYKTYPNIANIKKRIPPIILRPGQSKIEPTCMKKSGYSPENLLNSDLDINIDNPPLIFFLFFRTGSYWLPCWRSSPSPTTTLTTPTSRAPCSRSPSSASSPPKCDVSSTDVRGQHQRVDFR